MSFRLIDSDWARCLEKCLHADASDVCLITPFIKGRASERLLKPRFPDRLKVITRFALGDFASGVSDIAALQWLLDQGAELRGVKNLHAKVYVFGDKRAVVTSANLTSAALLRNHEFGFVAEEKEIVRECRAYFDTLWEKAGLNVTSAQLEEWDRIVSDHLVVSAGLGAEASLPDEGAEASMARQEIGIDVSVTDSDQCFVKLFGSNDDRAARSTLMLEEVKSSGCHWACTYPKGKRPRQVRDGAVMYMAKLVKEPSDILIYGRGIGMSHVDGRDDATAEDIKVRPWKKQWPHYVRVHHAEFLDGTLENGVSLTELMEHLESDAFLSTQRNARKGSGNIDPRRAYRRQAAVALTPEATAWLNEAFESALQRHGKLSALNLAQLDRPAIQLKDHRSSEKSTA